MKNVSIYCDGACSGNPGPGGWGAILKCESPLAEKELSGSEASTTNNRMELTAVIMAVRDLKTACRVTIATDSKYVVNAFTEGWLEKWAGNGWRTAARKPVKNVDLWEELTAALAPHKVCWEWIKGHAGHAENERADQLATAARDSAANR